MEVVPEGLLPPPPPVLVPVPSVPSEPMVLYLLSFWNSGNEGGLRDRTEEYNSTDGVRAGLRAAIVDPTMSASNLELSNNMGLTQSFTRRTGTKVWVETSRAPGFSVECDKWLEVIQRPCSPRNELRVSGFTL